MASSSLSLTVAFLAVYSVTAQLAQQRIDWKGNNWAQGCTFAGETFGELEVKADLCGPACEGNPRCSHFYWKPSDKPGPTGSCKLMGGRVAKTSAVVAPVVGFVCGVSLAANVTWADLPWTSGCEFDGSHPLRQVTMTTAEGCGRSCDSELSCTHYSWNRNSGGTCMLMSGSVTKLDAYSVEDKAAVCGVTSIAARLSTPAPVNWAGRTWARGCDFPDRQFEMTKEQTLQTGEDCRNECAATHGCTHFTWSRGTCRMKSAPLAQCDAFATGDPETVCGVVPRPTSLAVEWHGRSWAVSCDFPGIDYKSVPVGRADCGAQCDADAQCTHYAWSNADGGTCRLLAGRTTKEDALPVPDGQAQCGVRSQPSGGSPDWVFGCRFQHSSEQSGAVSARVEQCMRSCGANLDCSRLTWTAAPV